MQDCRGGEGLIAKGLLVLAFFLFVTLTPGAARAAEEVVTVAPFGTITLYQSRPARSNLVLFVSGDGGWNQGVVDMARALAEDGALVAGIDITKYLKTLEAGAGPCAYPASDFETLSKVIQKTKGFPAYVPPVLVGYSSGAALVYALLAQAPPNTFLGAISLGFCPDLPLKRRLCKGYGLRWTTGPKGKGVSFLPAERLHQPWIALQGTIDPVCAADATKMFVGQVADGEVVVLPKVGHGFSVQRNWMPQFRRAFAKITAGSPTVEPVRQASLADLPLVELPATGGGNALAIIVSGDGGWAGIDRDLGHGLVGLGVPVVGLNSLRYFWSPRTPDQAAKDLDRILTHYLDAWGKARAILIGYSMGADVLPFMVTRLPPATRSRVGGLVLLGPSPTAQFEFHLTSWVGVTPAAKSYPTGREVERLGDLHPLCVAGTDDSNSLCREDLPNLDRHLLEGGHHFGGDYQRIVNIIAQRMGLP